ncbi:MAG: CDP-glucose 4,6-dehydratase [Actinobacteria bacterium HGW-Actinobacteria-7]|nr:MAG: CDP-glucose 4,6-dehydratase [Actinobacteria bacterium HGW-Actinobacteria-7]
MGDLFGGVYRNRRVFVTGHTGFKGAWLSLWLTEMGARVTGFALEPPTNPSLFELAGVESRLERHIIGDVRDRGALLGAMVDADPEFAFHLAAQPLVRLSYEQPVETLATNVMGTAHFFEAVRAAGSVRVALNVTSDKCYENRESEHAYREDDAMGGFDPYSASKGCAEIVTAAYRRSFFGMGSDVRVASARAGNVIGGGDWAADRIVPDSIRALTAGDPIVVRNPDAVRPWQHVLEPLSGYLLLAQHLWEQGGEAYAEGWNFGPQATGSVSVGTLVDGLVAAWGSGSWESPELSDQPHEANLLRLDCSKAHARLGWQPHWDVETTLDRTARWYGAWHENHAAVAAASIDDLDAYVSAARSAGAAWA